MTIGIGMMTTEGPLVGADQLEIDGYTKTYRCKFRTPRFEVDHRLVIMMAGNKPNATAVAESIEDAFSTPPDDKSTEAIRRILKRMATIGMKGVDKSDHQTFFYLLVSIWLQHENRARLFCVSGAHDNGQAFEVAEYKSVGVGSFLGECLAKQAYSATKDLFLTTLLLARALKICKENVDGCGGSSDMYLLSHSGLIVPIPFPFIVVAEVHSLSYDHMMQKLFVQLSDVGAEPVIFDALVQNARMHVEQLRAMWCKENGSALSLKSMFDRVLGEQ